MANPGRVTSTARVPAWQGGVDADEMHGAPGLFLARAQRPMLWLHRHSYASRSLARVVIQSVASGGPHRRLAQRRSVGRVQAGQLDLDGRALIGGPRGCRRYSYWSVSVRRVHCTAVLPGEATTRSTVMLETRLDCGPGCLKTTGWVSAGGGSGGGSGRPAAAASAPAR